MKDWFTVDRIDETTYVISEQEHWEETHCYLLLGESKALLIDTGLGVAKLSEVTKRLTSLPIEVVLTHAHWDHMGSLGEYKYIAVHYMEAGWLTTKFPLPRDAVLNNLLKEPCHVPENFSKEDYKLYQGKVDCLLSDRDQLDLGGRKLEVLHTPGHSPGHICLYEREKGYLYAGDLLYLGKLDLYYPTTDPDLYMESIEKIRKLSVTRILPGHHRMDVPNSLADQVGEALKQLKENNLLHQGKGIFSYDGFSIHL
ncbi:hypothetical protein lbkm_3669 [Lachnospiraceae bacterium KM106-2]|nr:hypothetical protein lbkm_3669 [Lachnospiraceae bacterium KM106-2]